MPVFEWGAWTKPQIVLGRSRQNCIMHRRPFSYPIPHDDELDVASSTPPPVDVKGDQRSRPCGPSHGALLPPSWQLARATHDVTCDVPREAGTGQRGRFAWPSKLSTLDDGLRIKHLDGSADLLGALISTLLPSSTKRPTVPPTEGTRCQATRRHLRP